MIGWDDPEEPWDPHEREDPWAEGEPHEDDSWGREDEELLPDEEVEPPPPGEMRGLRVLVVVGEEVRRRVLLGELDYLGCESATVPGIDEAVEALSRRPFEVVVADYGLPGMAGGSAVDAFHRAARAAAPASPDGLVVFAVTGTASMDDADDARAAGFDDLLAGSVTLEGLTRLLRRHAPEPGLEEADDPAGVEITGEPDLSPEEEARVHLHTFLNILNLLSGQLHLLASRLGHPDGITDALERIEGHLEAVRSGKLDPALADGIGEVRDALRAAVAEAAGADPPPEELPGAREVLGNVESMLEVLGSRLEEYLDRPDGGLAWRAHSALALAEQLTGFLDAVQRNAREAYHIVPVAAAQESGDYLARLRIEGPDGGDTLHMPPVLSDVLRDLVANARKYTPPGGVLRGELVEEEGGVRLVVEDSGMGIPSDEVERVVELGYRASNARDRDTWGGGFGLTKAWLVTRRLGGRLWIDSEPGRGTRVTLRIPSPPGG